MEWDEKEMGLLEKKSGLGKKQKKIFVSKKSAKKVH